MTQEAQYTLATLMCVARGPVNTAAVHARAAERAAELGIKKIVVASSTGQTALQALDHFPPERFSLICVRYVTGFKGPDSQRMTPEMKAELESHGVEVITAAHAFGGVGRGVRTKLETFQVDEIMAHTLRMLGQGMKVGVEIALMAADHGAVSPNEDIITLSGSGRGSDTALVIKPANSHACLELKVREILAKPFEP